MHYRSWFFVTSLFSKLMICYFNSKMNTFDTNIYFRGNCDNITRSMHEPES